MARPHRTKSYTIEASTPASSAPAGVMRRILSPSTWPAWQSEIVSAEGPEPLEEGDVVEGRARLLGFDVRGKLDFAQVGLMGHSRGGEGMRAALAQLRDPGSPWPGRIGADLRIRSVYEIGPVIATHVGPGTYGFYAYPA